MLIAAPWQSGDFIWPVEGDSGGMPMFQKATGIAPDPFGGFLVLDAGANEILRLDSVFRCLARTGGYGWGVDGMDDPQDLATPDGLDIYVADYGNHRILRFDRRLAVVGEIPSSKGAGEGRRDFGYPRGIALSRFGKLLIVDGEHKRITVLNTEGSVEGTFGGMDAGRGRLRNPGIVRSGPNDRIYVQDGNTIVVFDIFGNYLTTLGRDVFENLSTFTVGPDTVYAVDGSRVYSVDAAGRMRTRFEVPQLPRAASHWGRISGCTLRGRDLVILYERNIRCVSLDNAGECPASGN